MGHVAPSTPFEAALDRHPEYLEWGRYAQHLERYLSLFNREQVLVLLFDDLVNGPADVVRTLYQFLGVDRAFVPAVVGRRVNVSRLPRWPIVDRVAHDTAGLLRQTKAGTWLWWQALYTTKPLSVSSRMHVRDPQPSN